MRRAFVVVVVLVACKSTDRWDTAIAEMDAFRARMCACKDAACANGVAAEIKAWERGMAKKFGDKEPPERIAKRAAQIESDTRACHAAVVKPAGSAASAASAANAAVDASADPVLAKMIGFRDRMCACKDEACIDAVNGDMAKFANDEMVNPTVTPATAMDDHIKRMTEVSKQTTDCIIKVMSPSK